jgi:hypothetical protein
MRAACRPPPPATTCFYVLWAAAAAGRHFALPSAASAMGLWSCGHHAWLSVAVRFPSIAPHSGAAQGVPPLSSWTPSEPSSASATAAKIIARRGGGCLQHARLLRSAYKRPACSGVPRYRADDGRRCCNLDFSWPHFPWLRPVAPATDSVALRPRAADFTASRPRAAPAKVPTHCARHQGVLGHSSQCDNRLLHSLRRAKTKLYDAAGLLGSVPMPPAMCHQAAGAAVSQPTSGRCTSRAVHAAPSGSVTLAPPLGAATKRLVGRRF